MRAPASTRTSTAGTVSDVLELEEGLSLDADYVAGGSFALVGKLRRRVTDLQRKLRDRDRDLAKLRTTSPTPPQTVDPAILKRLDQALIALDGPQRILSELQEVTGKMLSQLVTQTAGPTQQVDAARPRSRRAACSSLTRRVPRTHPTPAASGPLAHQAALLRVHPTALAKAELA